MNKYLEFRQNYKNFYYHGYDIDYNDNYILIMYYFEVEGLISFNPTLKIPVTNKKYDKNIVEKMVFSCGLAEIASYWKCTCSPNIIIECGLINDDQVNWLKKLLYRGLGEFFYTNNIIVNQDDFVNIVSSGKEYNTIDNGEYDGYLIAIGGGKDSLTSLEILKKFNNKKGYIINNRKICFEGAKIAGIDEIVNVERCFDKKIIETNNQGFLNGHTPISSCIAFIGVLSAYLNGMKYVILSNESSANESSVIGTDINHQYSKSLEFENDFRYYLKKYITDKIDYFSLLRPLSELQIMKIFTNNPKYFNSFISCNNGGKSKNIGKIDGWCCNCPKCLFIYILMSNFVNQDEMIKIFGENLLDKKDMLDSFLSLLGKTQTKPFECVGTIEEVEFSVNNLIKKLDKLPYLLKYYKDNYDVSEPNYNLLNNFDLNNNVPNELIDILKEEIDYDK